MLFIDSEVDKKQREVDTQLHALTAHMDQLQNKQTSLEEEKFELDTEVDKQSAGLNEREREYQSLMKDYDYAKEREAVLMGDR